MAAAWARAGLVVAAVVALDQAVKALVVHNIGTSEKHDLFLGIDLVHVRNSGIAFGLFEGGGPILILVTIALAALVGYFATHTDRALLWLATGLLVGGALGNLLDRARDGAVTDFIDPPLWPAFNVADMAITAGVLVLLLSLELAHEDDA